MAQDLQLLQHDSNEDDNKLTRMLMQDIHGENKEHFNLNFQLYLLNGNDNSKFVVDLDNVWEWLGYSTKGSAKKTLIKNFEENIDFRLSTSIIPSERRVHGGQNKEQILMNVETFKGLCMLANTEKGKRTRKYYSKMEAIFFKYLEEQNQAQMLALELNMFDMKNQHAINLHKKLVESHKKTPLVYVTKVQEIDDETFIIKLGETDDIEQRVISLRPDYTICLLMDVFPCAKPHAFEQYLLHRKDIVKHKVGTETIKISNDFTYEELIRIIKKHIDNFNGLSPNQQVEMARMKHNEKLLQLIANTEDVEVKKKLLELLSMSHNEVRNVPIETPIDNDSDNEDEEYFQDRNRRVFKYSPDDLKNPVQTFLSLREAARSLNNQNIHDYHIRNVCLNNTVFAGFRWYLVDGNTEIPENIPETVESNIPEKAIHKKGFVAQISLDKKTIVNVFPNQAGVITATQLSSSQISSAITKKRQAGNFYWEMYDNCSPELQTTFTGTLPKPLRVGTCSKSVQRIDPVTNEVLETFSCIQDVTNAHRICHKTIHKVSANGDIYKGYKWNVVES